MTDVAVIGGGIAGCATAALLAEAGAAVTLFEREAIAAGASGRNSGILQHPMDPALVALYEASLALYGGARRLRAARAGRRADRRRARRPAGGVRGGRRTLPGADARVARGRRAARRRARPRRRSLRLSRERRAADRADRRHQRVGGESTGGRRADRRRRRRVRRAAAGSACAASCTRPARWWPRPDRGRRRRSAAAPRGCSANWGVVAQVRLRKPPRHAIEQAGVEALTEPGAARRPSCSRSSPPARSRPSARRSPTTSRTPPPSRPRLVERGARFIPELEHAAIEHVRACARPLAADGRPLLGAIERRPVPGHRPRRVGHHARAGVGAAGGAAR